jgi:hypothetical protein
MARTFYLLGVIGLAVYSLFMAVLIILGEMTDNYTVGVAAVGLILIAYGWILLFLRRLGLIGPRGPEGR